MLVKMPLVVQAGARFTCRTPECRRFTQPFGQLCGSTFSVSNIGKTTIGYTTGGKAWYRKLFTLNNKAEKGSTHFA